MSESLKVLQSLKLCFSWFLFECTVTGNNKHNEENDFKVFFFLFFS